MAELDMAQHPQGLWTPCLGERHVQGRAVFFSSERFDLNGVDLYYFAINVLNMR